MVEFPPKPKKEQPSTPFDKALKLAGTIHEADPRVKISKVGEYEIGQTDSEILVVRFLVGGLRTHGIHVSTRDGEKVLPTRDIGINTSGEFVIHNFTAISLAHERLDEEFGYEEGEDLLGEPIVYKSEQRKAAEEKLRKQQEKEYEAQRQLGIDIVSNSDVLEQLIGFRDLLGRQWLGHINFPEDIGVKGLPTDETTIAFKYVVETLAKNKSMKSEWHEDGAHYELKTSRDGRNPDHIYFERATNNTSTEDIEFQHNQVWEFFADNTPVQYHEWDQVSADSLIRLIAARNVEKYEMVVELNKQSRRKVETDKANGLHEADPDQISNGLALLKSKIGQ